MTISIAKQFSKAPAGRYRADGPTSGEQFRDDLLVPALKRADKIEVDLDGALGYGSSFLEEAFGGLVRCGFPLDVLERKLQIHSSLSFYKDRIWSYIRDAERLRTAH